MKKSLVRTNIGKNFFLLVAVLLVVCLVNITPAIGQTLKWKIQLPGAVLSDMAVTDDGTTLYVPVLAGAGEPALHAVDPATGAVQWTSNIDKQIVGTPVIGPAGTIYMGSGNSNRMYAIRPQGTVKWFYESTGWPTKSAAIGRDRTLYFGTPSGGAFHAVEPDGSHKWTSQNSLNDRIAQTPVIGSDGTIYVGIYRYLNGNFLYAFNPDSTVKWASADLGTTIMNCAIGTDGTIYVNTAQKLYAISPTDGSTTWQLSDINAAVSSPVIGADGTIYIGSTDNKLYAINPQGTVKWTFSTGGWVSKPAVASDGRIYVGSYDNKAYGVNPANGTLAWLYDTGREIQASPLIGDDGTIYVVTANGQNPADNYLYALNGNGSRLADTPWPAVARNNVNTGDIREYFIPEPIFPVNNEIIPTSQGASVNFSWLPVDGVSSYRFEFSSTPDFLNPTPFIVSSPNFVGSLTQPTVGVQYFWRVAPTSITPLLFCDVQNFAYGSPPIQALISTPVYDAIVSSPAPVSWEAFPGASFYYMQIDDEPSFTAPHHSESKFVVSNFNNLDLAPGTYYLRVYPTDSSLAPIVSIWSHAYKFTVVDP
ncbi:MAG: PQQ-binding-like beta-propeller repeat protein [Desulfobacter sp.]